MLVTRQDILSLKKLSTTKEAVPVDSLPLKKIFNYTFLEKRFLKRMIAYLLTHTTLNVGLVLCLINTMGNNVT